VSKPDTFDSRAKVHYVVKARRPERGYEAPKRYWMQVGMATGLMDGTVMLMLDALPFGFDGELKLFLKDDKE
jgi:hypothetical protein